MNLFQSKILIILFALFVAFFVLINSPVALAGGAWVLVEQSSEDSPSSRAVFDTVKEVKTSATSCTQKLRYVRPGKGGYSGGSNCEASWSIPPKIMKPDETIQFIRQASAKGQDSRVGWIQNSNCSVTVNVTLMNPDGRAIMGDNIPMETCDPRIGVRGGRVKASDTCNVRSEWIVPKGNDKDILYFSPTVRGCAGTGIRHFKYIYNADAKPPPPPEPPPEESLEVTLTSDKFKVYVGKIVTLTADVHGGRPPFMYEWSIGENGKRNARQYQTTKSFSTPGRKKVSVTVVDGDGKSDTAEVVITVRKRSVEVPPEGCPDSGRFYRPAGLTPLPGQRVKAGIYELWVGQSNTSETQPDSWRTHRQYRLEGGNKYLFLIDDFGAELPQVLKNPADLIKYSTPTKDVAVAYYRIKTPGDKWAATCLKRLGPLTLDDTRPGVFPQAPCAGSGRFYKPAGLTPQPGQRVKAGIYELWVGQSNTSQTQPDSWRAHRQYRLEGGNKYLFLIDDFGPELPQVLKNPADLIKYSTPTKDVAVAYYRIKTPGDKWAATCLKRLGPLTLGDTRPGVFPQAPCAWDTVNPKGHSDTPGITIGRSLRPGGWWLWLADAGVDGRDEPNKWTRHGPYAIEGNKSYLFHLSQFEDPSLKMDPMVNPGQVLRYETHRDTEKGKTYFENYTIGGHWAAVCFAPATAEELGAISPSDADTSGMDIDSRYVPVGSVKLASTHNKGGVENGPSVPIVINTKTFMLVKSIQTYHWNGGRGSEPSTISIQTSDGQILGPWQAKGLANLSGKPGPPHLYWRVEPQAVLKPGKYRIIDSDPATWSTNATSGNRGFFKMEYQEVEINTAQPEIELGSGD